MDVRHYAAMRDVFVEKAYGLWFIIGFLEPGGWYHSLRRWKPIGKKDDTAIRNIDKFKDNRGEIPNGDENK